MRMFADDVKIWNVIRSDVDNHTLQEDLHSLTRWSEKWLLKLNASKCKIIHIGHRPCTVYHLHDDAGNSIAIEQTEEEKDLGVHVTEDLKSSTQCVRSAAKARSVMGMISRNFRILDKDDFLLIHEIYIRPRMEYCVQAWSPHLKKDTECLERVPRGATIDLRVAAIKSTESTWPLQVKSSHFSSKSPPKFSTQVAAEF